MNKLKGFISFFKHFEASYEHFLIAMFQTGHTHIYKSLISKI